MVYRRIEDKKRYGREYYKRCAQDPEFKKRRAEYDSIYEKTNREKVALRNRRWREKNKQLIYGILGNKCVKCGFSDPRALQIDHINGGGKKEMTQTYKTHSRMIWGYLKLSPDEIRKKLQILCANCNWIKVHENKERFCIYF